MITAGNSEARFVLKISVKTPSGSFRKAWVVYSDSLWKIEELTQGLYLRRKAMSRHMSSAYLFGGRFAVDSLEWVVCHTVLIEIVDQIDGEIIESQILEHPYLEAINIRF